MEQAQRKDFGKPDEMREFPQGRVELVNIGGATVGRAVFEPGWRWSTSVQPLVKTRSCEAPYCEVSLLPSGHDAWVVGNEPAVVVDFQGMIDYAQTSERR
jgi:hypothetical protein